MTEADNFYVFVRVLFSVVGAAAWIWILRKSIPLARRAEYEDQRLFVVTIVLLLFLVAGLLTLTALYDWDRPPPPDGALAVIGMAIRAVVAVGGFVLLVSWPWNRPPKRPARP